MRRFLARYVVLALVAAALAHRPVVAHDIWLQADSYVLARGDTLTVRQLLGPRLETDFAQPDGAQELPVLRDLTARFSLVNDAASVDLLAELPDLRSRPKVQPVLERIVDSEGLALVAMDHSILYTDHSNEEFFGYLDHEGLAHEEFLPHMAATTYQGKGYQSEGYQRSLKTLVRVGDAASAKQNDLPARVLGQTIEILLPRDLYALAPGDPLEVKVLLRGKPLPGQLVKAYRSSAPGDVAEQQTVTDSDGVARLTLEGPGRWLIRLVHLTPCSAESDVDCSDTTWESYWAAYSFAIDG